MVGDARPFIAALVTLDADALPGWLQRHHLPAETTVAHAAELPQVRDAIAALVEKANGAVSRAEAIKEFHIVPTDFTEDSGHLTPSLKIKRAQVLKDYEAVLEDIYAGSKPRA